MISEEIINKAVSRIAAAAPASKVILFGSCARGEAHHDSDLDFLVVEPQVENRGMEMVRLRNAIGSVGVGVDILVFSSNQAEERSRFPGDVVYWAYKEGRVVYEGA